MYYKNIFNIILKSFILIIFVTIFSNAIFANSLSQEEKKVKEIFTYSLDIIKNLDMEEIYNKLYDANSSIYISRINDFFSEYPDAKDMVKEMLLDVDYEIVSVDRIEDKIIIKTKFIMPEYNKYISRALPKIFLSNFMFIFKKELTSENIYSILEYIHEEFVKEKTKEDNKKLDFVLDLNFIKKNDIWLLDNNYDIVKKLSKLFKFKL